MNEEVVKPKSDLGVRALSAIVMVAVAGTALWLKGYTWMAFAVIVGVGAYYEWCKLAFAITDSALKRAIWILGGLLYIGLAAFFLSSPVGGPPFPPAIIPIMAVVGTDIGAYFVGRAIGGPKIAPKISPSKTWSGLIGGMVGATIFSALVFASPLMWYCDVVIDGRNACDLQPFSMNFDLPWGEVVAFGAISACIAQAGDFFESWMKRRAGVKDSGALIPAHGGLLDRVDGLIAVAFVSAVLALGREFL